MFVPLLLYWCSLLVLRILLDVRLLPQPQCIHLLLRFALHLLGIDKYLCLSGHLRQLLVAHMAKHDVGVEAVHLLCIPLVVCDLVDPVAVGSIPSVPFRPVLALPVVGYYLVVSKMEIVDDLIDLIGGLTADVIRLVRVREVKQVIIEAFDAVVRAVMAGVSLWTHQEFGRFRCLVRLVAVFVAR